MANPNFDPLALVLATSQRHGHGIYLGKSLGANRGPLFARPQDGVLLLGPPRSGKTAAVVIPNVLAACGPVVAASTKADVFSSTWAPRSRLGTVGLYDPSGSVPCPPGVERVGWSPLGLARSWDGAVIVAEAMVRAARPGADRGESVHWNERASALLSALLHAVALEQRPFSELLTAVNRHEGDEALAALARHGADRALDLLAGIAGTDSREQSGIWSTASGVLAAYRTDSALASTSGRLLDVADLLENRGSLFICAGSDQQRQAAPLVAGLLREVRTAAYERSMAATLAGLGDGFDARPGARITSSQAPLLLVLDELANIAPLHDLPVLIAEGGSQGVLTLACLQDLSQARARWGQEADGFLSLFGSKLIFPGIGDTRTLEAVSLLAGEHDVPTISFTKTPRRGFGIGRRNWSQTVSMRKERLVPVDAIARGRPGQILGLEGVQPGLLEMTPWYSSSPWRDAVISGRVLTAGRNRAAIAAGPLRGLDRARGHWQQRC
jgi:type IV secretory pathway TraG/TraD family ATPase VirD4